MAIERWGSLSVADHNDTAALTANVLLYDRLVMPIYTEARDRNEREYRDEKGWNPDLQNQRREHLGDLIIECAWDETRRQSYTERCRVLAEYIRKQKMPVDKDGLYGALGVLGGAFIHPLAETGELGLVA